MPQDVLARAIAKAGTQEALAELIGQKRNAISNWKAGRPIPDDVLAFLADYVGEDPIRVLGREKGGLWKRLGAGVAAAVVVATISPGQATALPEQGAKARLYIMSTNSFE